MEGFGPSFAFWVLAALTLVAAGGVMVSRNLLHAVLFLILTFIGVAGFFVLLSADFIAMAQVIIYVGAIAVLVLFAVLLTPRSGRDNGETRWALPGILLAVCLAAIFLFVVHDTAWNTVDEAPAGLDARALGTALLTTWVVPFEIASVLLTAALVGAIMLTRSPEEEAEDALV
ncbi:NADH-quinone oxidoreductase subunit J [Tepidiforma flava]|uniref:NADH-quinone oxidoreductase subunit J n=1 Tax=Tepidiforma flava TaxID=3004094 RepID=A0ABY7M8G5_9CHLR|nr:NADH-quinone oxidoreductase subunit J [Tepidiforma flava]WBL35996.1 NADH-quinone oxidoreductase subunit J [Tepidiforma flava]